MNIEEAIKKAIAYETKIRDLYADTADKILNEKGKKFLKSLEEDEQNHVDYLTHKLEEIKKYGSLKLEEPIVHVRFQNQNDLTQEFKRIETALVQKDFGLEKQILSKALQAEIETSAFYEMMVRDFTGEGKALFENFLKIENEHIEIVQAQLDHIMNTGYWFGMKEFDME